MTSRKASIIPDRAYVMGTVALFGIPGVLCLGQVAAWLAGETGDLAGLALPVRILFTFGSGVGAVCLLALAASLVAFSFGMVRFWIRYFTDPYEIRGMRSERRSYWNSRGGE